MKAITKSVKLSLILFAILVTFGHPPSLAQARTDGSVQKGKTDNTYACINYAISRCCEGELVWDEEEHGMVCKIGKDDKFLECYLAEEEGCCARSVGGCPSL